MDKKYNTETAIPQSDPGTPDPISLDQQAKYKQQGLTVTSNNTSIIPRDSAGNIMLQENSETNPLLIIEPVTTKITTNSILRVIDTQFQYYSFPVSVRATTNNTSFDLNIDLDALDVDPIFARYKPSTNFIIDTGAFSGILMDEVEAGVLQKNANAYYITKEIKNSGIDLRFRIKLNHQFITSNPQGIGTVYFSIIKSGPNFNLNRKWIEFGGGEIKMVDNIQDVFFDGIILNSEFEIGDNFGIGALAGQRVETISPGVASAYHRINPEQSYWVITDAAKTVDEWNQEI
tara:strand:- start:1145 stop:2011 length:867 start_codon:yes stop_codon:yes gene_type:complete